MIHCQGLISDQPHITWALSHHSAVVVPTLKLVVMFGIYTIYIYIYILNNSNYKYNAHNKGRPLNCWVFFIVLAAKDFL